MEALTCSHCCAPLPPPTGNTAVCRFCGTAHFLAPASRTAPDEDDDFDDDDDDIEDDDDDLIPMTDAAIVALLRERFDGNDSFYIPPAIPAKKERNVRVLHAAHLPAHEPILGLYDGTVFGAADDGFVITARRLCWRNIMEGPGMRPWEELPEGDICIEGQYIKIGKITIQTIANSDSDFLDTVEEVFPILVRSAKKAIRSAPAAPPQQAGYGYGPPSQGYGVPPQQAGYGYGPPQQAGYGYPQMPQQQQPLFGCWHCRVPLHWQSPRCGLCGAMPGPQGWPRLA